LNFQYGQQGTKVIAMQEVTSADSAISLSDSAAAKVRELLHEQDKQGQVLRVYIQGGGCSGFQYGFNFESSAASDDALLQRDGVTVAVDPMSYQYLDYKEDLQGARFVINNPNATTTCGCGSSFSI
jgi:iron-sulfur cluster assembly accessory protein